MSDKGEIIKLRLIGDDAKPHAVKVRDLGMLLTYFEKALSGLIVSNSGGLIDEKDVYLTLVDVKDESAGYPMMGFSPQNNFQPAIHSFDKILSNKEDKPINDKAFENINKIGGWLRTHKWDAQVYYKDDHVTTFDKNFRLQKQIPDVQEKATIYGRIIDVGKEDPRAEIRLITGETIFIPVSVEKASSLGKFLYQKVGLIGRAKIDPIKLKIIDFQLEDYVILDADETISEKFEVLRSIIGDVWDKIDDPFSHLNASDA